MLHTEEFKTDTYKIYLAFETAMGATIQAQVTISEGEEQPQAPLDFATVYPCAEIALKDIVHALDNLVNAEDKTEFNNALELVGYETVHAADLGWLHGELYVGAGEEAEAA
ncbi:hypothetical protein [Corynebacterium minutissimum]|uniref:Uncharacterized protein n=1 Tax=Corynebacterium minutissimum TaxID=38301 RepID=A0A376CX17_9CORY|nr:hypothetical protein [Corynebacterium minutissimum]QRP60657.1 hypothetical protein I6J26_10975 [Corynebacterium minutissimum]STC76719.1 Uncharacterised protein [Corynebacterium minutissimum]